MKIFISKRKGYMDIFEEKRQLIEKIACQKEDTLELKLELKQLLLKDTNGGKLYKYRSFDKDGYSLKNLEEGTLHCSLVEAFNDPFDSKFGIHLKLCTKHRVSIMKKRLMKRCIYLNRLYMYLKGIRKLKILIKKNKEKLISYCKIEKL